MAKSSRIIMLELQIRDEPDRPSTLSISAENRSPQPLTLVATPKYFRLEMENEHGQFVSGESTLTSSLPTAKDYKKIGPRAKVLLLELPIERLPSSPNTVIIGQETFTGVPPKARARVTYSAADRIMPNLPPRDQPTFFPGPIDSVSDPIPISGTEP